jgi:uncharacterized cupin superfamily protein
MQRVTIEDIDAVVDSSTIKRPLTEALEASNLAINYYELAPGDSFAYGYHAHDSQEELFLIQSGTVTFETESGDVLVSEGECIRFSPGEYQQGTNRHDDRVRAFAIGAPKDTGGSEVLRYCEHCEKQTPQNIGWSDDGDAKETSCEVCGELTGQFE